MGMCWCRFVRSVECSESRWTNNKEKSADRITSRDNVLHHHKARRATNRGEGLKARSGGIRMQTGEGEKNAVWGGGRMREEGKEKQCDRVHVG